MSENLPRKSNLKVNTIFIKLHFLKSQFLICFPQLSLDTLALCNGQSFPRIYLHLLHGEQAKNPQTPRGYRAGSLEHFFVNAHQAEVSIFAIVISKNASLWAKELMSIHFSIDYYSPPSPAPLPSESL
jgi:hypothetical protein